ncbi:MAG: DNA-3-methyladenine glycosylase [Bacteroidetes bacterium]|nr:DNA-3-methyladenine glycosylase [Bacteroidota bacterium]
MKLTRDFYTRPDVVTISRELLGKFLVTRIAGQLTSGMIVETEAYCGRNDKACHANNGRRTKRTEIMFEGGGKAYVYLCYGIHHLFNVTTNIDGLADAVLIRAIEPVDGVDLMLKRRNKPEVRPDLTSGPGALSQALEITTSHYGQDLLGDTVWIENRDCDLTEEQIIAGNRIGVDYAGEDAFKPWRFVIKDSPWMSKPRI